MPTPSKPFTLFISCEHGGNRLPLNCRSLFAGQGNLLESHRGYDKGALMLAYCFRRAFYAPLIAGTTSRLVVDLNRSVGHRHLHSSTLSSLSSNEKKKLVNNMWKPYRNRVSTTLRNLINAGNRVLHLSCHSFTPQLDGNVRNADIGLLYDPARLTESITCRQWRAELVERGLCVRLNYPYSGKSDGLTSAMRKLFAEEAYLGIELEVNQKLLVDGQAKPRSLGRYSTDLHQTLTATLRSVLAGNAEELPSQLSRQVNAVN